MDHEKGIAGIPFGTKALTDNESILLEQFQLIIFHHKAEVALKKKKNQ